MTWPWPAVAVAIGAAAAGLLALLGVRTAPARLTRENHAGRRVPAVLGLAFVGGLLLAAPATLAFSGRRFGPVEAVTIGAVALVAGAGLLDDLLGGGAERGFRGHLGGLIRGRPTTGVLKLVVGIGSGLWLALVIGGGPARVTATTVLVAASANLWNALDVRPGRSAKWGIVALVPALPAAGDAGMGLVAGAALGAALGVLPFDLAERGMLGDAGSNPLGLVAGAGLAVILPTPWLAVAAATALLLQVAAETVTISRVVEAVPPLRWFDRLGRRT
jgi:hypothetical protein